MIDISKWAFENKKLIYFLIAVLIVGGAYSSYEMSKLEDPEITVKLAMVVTTYPGASAHQVELEVTDVLEKNIRSMGNIDNVESYSYNDLSLIQVELKTTVKETDVEQCWDLLRRKVANAQAELPEGASPSIVKDDFGNVYGMFFALTGDGLSDRELSDYSELIKREVSELDGVERVDLYGNRPECINISLLQDRMANLGVKPAEVLATLNGQNKTTYTGYYDNGDSRIRVTVSDKFKTVEDIGRMLIQGHDADQLRLSDIARIEKDYEDPTRNELFYDRQRAMGIMVAASSDADIIKVGKRVEQKLEQLKAERLPAGMECHKVFYQPERVGSSLGTFILNLIESVIIVVVILMIAMGFKSGVIIGISLVVTVFGTFLFLYFMDGTMQRVSLASFVLAMGMLVDNAIVIIDGILVDLKAGKSRMEAMTAIGRQTAMPLLSATLIAIIAFLPIFMSPDTAGVYTRDLFIVLAVSLLLSWVLALVHVPLMANRILHPDVSAATATTGKRVYEGKIYAVLRSLLRFSLAHRWSFVFAMIALVVLSGFSYRFMKQGFFPDMVYDQLYMEYKLPEGINSTRVARDLEEIEAYLKKRPEITHVTTSIGGTPARYNLVRNIANPSLSYGELIIDFTSPDALVDNMAEIQQYLSSHYPDAYVKLNRYNLMFKKYPIEAQFTGPDPAVLHQLADSARKIMENCPDVCLITTDWEPQVPVLTIEYDQPTARAIGLSRNDVSLSLLTATSGIPIGSFYEGIHKDNIYLRCLDEHGKPIENLDNTQIFSSLPSLNGLLTQEMMMKLKTGTLSKEELVETLMGTTPLKQISKRIDVKWEDPVVPRYNGQRSQRVQCSPVPGVETEKARQSIAGQIERIPLPDGYKLQWQGERNASTKSMQYLFKNFPFAIRSSSLLEDSHYQPFAGIYNTYMIPYLDDRYEMLRMLSDAIKGVYASVYFRDSKAYMQATSNVIDQEKMAVILQEVVGNQYGDRYYPSMSGVARSLNYYPLGDEKAEEGTVNLALGLGKYIVDGGMTLRFSPYHPNQVLQTSEMEIALKETQTRFYALDLKNAGHDFSIDDGFNLLKLHVKEAENDGALRYIASTYDPYDQVIRDGLYPGGRKVITFANILQHDVFPLPRILQLVLKYGEQEMRRPVEIEFAATMSREQDKTGTFYLLQIRPIVDSKEMLDEDLNEIRDEDVILRSYNSLGHGIMNEIHDIVYVKTEGYSASNNQAIAWEIEKINRQFLNEGKNYVLVGPGRWGSSDTWLGIPVKWPHISAARVIVEAGLTNYRVDPSQGTHFFQNLTSFGVGYFTINAFMNDGVYDQDFLNAQPAVDETKFLRHVRFEKPMIVKMDGKKKLGVVLRPED